MKFVVIYHRYHQEYKAEFDTQEEAAQWTLDQEYLGNISYDMILDPKGVVIDDGSAGYEKLRQLGAKEDD